MKDTNKVLLIGRLTRDAEMNDGKCSFSIAFNTTKKNDDSYADESNYLNLMLFGKTASNLSPRLLKGTQVCVEGHLKQNRWEKDGQKFSAINVVVENIQLLGGSGKKAESNQQPSPSDNTDFPPDNDIIF